MSEEWLGYPVDVVLSILAVLGYAVAAAYRAHRGDMSNALIFAATLTFVGVVVAFSSNGSGVSVISFGLGFASAALYVAASNGMERIVVWRAQFLLIRLWSAIHIMIRSRRSVGVNQCKIQRTVAQAMFAGAFSLVPGHVRDEFGDEPIQHFLDDWTKRERGRWRWALTEIAQMCWVAGVERMRGAWRAVTQK